MTAAPLTFPGSRILAGWWRQLTPLQPQAFWVSHLLFHRVEAPITTAQTCPLDGFTRLVLQFVARKSGIPLEHLHQHLHVEKGILRRIIAPLEAGQLLQMDLNGCWSLTPQGRSALEQGEYPKIVNNRKVFYFLQSDRPDWPPHFIRLANGLAPFRPAGQEWTFKVGHLEACLNQETDWKVRNGFPSEVAKATATGISEWQKVVVDHPEFLLAVLVLTAEKAGPSRLTCFGVRPEGWALQAQSPVFESTSGYEELLPELKEDPAPGQWRQAWRTWCQPRNLPSAECDSCRLERIETRLRVFAPRSLIERLRALRSDALKGEAWVLAGKDRYRTAALLEVVESGSAIKP